MTDREVIYTEDFEISELDQLQDRIAAAMDLNLEVKVVSGIFDVRPVSGARYGFRLEVSREPYFNDTEEAE